MKISKCRKIILSIGIMMLFSVIPFNMWETDAATSLKNPKALSTGAVTWDCIYFGNYPQNDKTGKTKEKIKWRVLSVSGNDAFLLADKNLDGKPYMEESDSLIDAGDTKWENSTLRSWLNGYGSDFNLAKKDYCSVNFIDTAFTPAEKAAIKTTKVVNSKNPKYGTSGGKDTEDKIFLLSIAEAKNKTYGFTGNAKVTTTRTAKNTNFTSAKIGKNTNTGDAWWLRSAGYYESFVAFIYAEGEIDYDGAFDNEEYIAVRPALHLDLSSNEWSYAGTVKAKAEQKLTGKGSYEKAYGSKAFSLNVKAKGGAKLTYTSDNPKVASVNKAGKVTAKKPGITWITVKAGETSDYLKEEREICIRVTPKKVTGLKLKAAKRSLTAKWKKDPKATGYQIVYSTDKNFKKNVKRVTIKSNKTISKTIKKLKKGKKYYVKARGYKTIREIDGSWKLYGPYSSVKKVKVK